MLILRTHNVHVFAFTPGPDPYWPAAHTKARRRGSFPAWGVLIRWRDPRGTRRWRHFRWRLGVGLGGAPNREGVLGRGIAMAEFDSWLTSGTNRRIRRKVFLRLKAGAGGLLEEA